MGFEALARILEVCYKSGVRVVTIYAFSIENFKRSRYEVDALMDMAKTKLVQLSEHGALLERYNAKVRVLGDQSLMREDVRREIERAVEMTKGNEGAVLNVCFPYTGREEITRSVRETVREWSEEGRERERPGVGKRAFSETHIKRNLRAMPVVREEVREKEEEEEDSVLSDGSDDHTSRHEPVSSQTSHSTSPNMHPVVPTKSLHPPEKRALPDPETITAETLTKNTYTFDAPPLDLLIRTSGVQRLSDFMLWQCHEDTEIRFLDTLWPEFDLWQFLPVLVEWQWRQKKLMGESHGKKVKMV